MPLTEDQAAQLRNLAGADLRRGEDILAAADCQCWGWRALIFLPAGLLLALPIKLLIGGELGIVIGPMIGFPLAWWILVPRSKLLVTDSQILVLAKGRIIPGLAGAATSHQFHDLVPIGVEFKPFRGDVLTLVDRAGHGRRTRYYQLGGFRPSKPEFEQALTRTGPSAVSD